MAGLRIGMIGLDSSHCVEFARRLTAGPLAALGHSVTAAFPGVSPEIPRSVSRVAGFTAELAERHGVRICDSVAQVVAQVDAVMIEQVDGRQHLAAAREVFPARKPVFIDKPLAGSLADGIELLQLARQFGTPCFSASALRFDPAIVRLRGRRRDILSADAYSPCEIEPHHPDLFWYGVHGVEMLFAVLGDDCVAVSRSQTAYGVAVAGQWRNGQLGTFHGQTQPGGAFRVQARLSEGAVDEPIQADYLPLVRRIVDFLATGQAPVSAREMLQVLAFMEAADESKRRGGGPVALAEVMR